MSSQPLVSCRDLTKRFGSANVVDEVTFEVHPGSITGFVGANGAGKSTTMRMLLGLVRPTSGSALVHGLPYEQLDQPRRQVGAVLDGPGAHPGLTARTHLGILCDGAGIDRARVPAVLEQVGLADRARQRVGTFSLGMRQRLGLAGALLGDPPVLLLDEPANGLDPPGILWMRGLLRDLADEGRAVLVSSHLLGELAEVADRVVVIHRGRLVADATLPELLGGRRRVELRCADLAAASVALAGQGAAVERDGDTLLVHGLDAATVGQVVAEAGAGPIATLAERVASFEEAYFELAGDHDALVAEAVAR